MSSERPLLSSSSHPPIYRHGQFFLLAFLLVSGWLIRLYDLDDPPLDFHPTRQLFSALKARGLYYAAHADLLPEWKLEFALQKRRELATIEPEILEHLVAWTYTFTGEALWVARVYSSLFWVVGGAFLWGLVRRHFSATAAFLSLAAYLFSSYAVIASRSFQPDPLMVALLLAFWWACDRWQDSPTWKRLFLAGLFGGAAVLVKFPAIFFVAPFFLAWLVDGEMRRGWRNGQIPLLAVLIALPPGLYLVYGLQQGFLREQFGGRFFPDLWLLPLTYLRWMQEAQRAAGVWLIAFGLLGTLWLFVCRPQGGRGSLSLSLPALWLGYLLYGFAFTHHVTTHDYYHLPLVPLAAISAAPLFDLLAPLLADLFHRGWSTRLALFVLLIYALFGTLWGLRAQLKSVDFRPQAQMWAEIAEKLGQPASVIALTPDYGLALAYWGWQGAQLWPSSADLAYQEMRGKGEKIEALFARLTAGKRYFLVADLADFQRQPWLQARLQAFPLFAAGDGYRIYLLQP